MIGALNIYTHKVSSTFLFIQKLKQHKKNNEIRCGHVFVVNNIKITNSAITKRKANCGMMNNHLKQILLTHQRQQYQKLQLP